MWILQIKVWKIKNKKCQCGPNTLSVIDWNPTFIFCLKKAVMRLQRQWNLYKIDKKYGMSCIFYF